MDLNSKRVLIIKPSSLGDVVHAIPLAHAIKRTYPSCYVAWIVQNASAGILENDPSIDELIAISIPSTSDPSAGRAIYGKAAVATVAAMRDLRQKFRSAPFDLVLDLHASFRSGLFAWVARGAHRIGFSDAKELNTLFQDEHVVCPPGVIHAVDKNVEFARRLGAEPRQEDLRLFVGKEQRNRALRLLRANGVANDRPLAYVNACARWETKLWNLEAWAKLCRILKVHHSVNIVLGGAPADRAHLEAIRSASRIDCLVAAGELGLGESAALLEFSDLYIGVDSGPMHIAAFVGTPVVALFGPTDPAKVGPYGEGHRILRREELPCLGCRRRACDDRRCMDGLDPELVARVCLETLGSISRRESCIFNSFKS